MPNIKIDERDAEDICIAIGMRICMIETGTTHMRAVDAESFNSSWKPRIPDGTRHRVGQQWKDNPEKQVQIRALTREQRDLISRLEDMQIELRKKS
jgi:hypothetical protein